MPPFYFAVRTSSILLIAPSTYVLTLTYLRTVFERIADHPINRIDELLPWRLMPAEHVEQQAA